MRRARCSTRRRRCRSRPPTDAPSRRASACCASPSLEDVIIRPSHVYGSGGWFVEEFVDRLRKPGRFAVIGSGENWWDVVRVEDVAARLRRRRRARPGRGPLPRRRRRADPLLRLHRPRRRGPRHRPSAPPSGLDRAPRRGRRSRPRGDPLGPELQRPDQVRTRLVPALPDRPPRACRTRSTTCLEQTVRWDCLAITCRKSSTVVACKGDLGDLVCVIANQRGRGRGSGAAVEQRYALLYEVRGDKITRFTAYSTPAEALEAAGLSE